MSPTRNRPSDDALARLIRSEVYEGKLRRGELLPPVQQLAERYGTSAKTMQETLRVLVDQGILEARGRRVSARQGSSTGALLLLLQEAREMLAPLANRGTPGTQAAVRAWLARAHEAGVDG